MNLNKPNEGQVVLEAQDSTNFSYFLPTQIPDEVFRAYDIRGLANAEGLTPNIAYAIGLAIGSEARELTQTTVIVGRDARLSGPLLTEALMRGLLETGMDVIDIGIVPTPVLYFATNTLETNTGVMVTASHNPADHNGFKIVLNGKTLTTDSIRAIRDRIYHQNFKSGLGKKKQIDVIDAYLKNITERIQLKRPLKVVVDCGNGVAGSIVPRLYRLLGCEVIELFCEVDGSFPNHHPDPTIPENLETLIETVIKTGADLGLAFDGDADRLGMVTNTGEIIWPDRQMMLFSIDVLKRVPGATIIFDVKCSKRLSEVITEYGGQPLMWRTGHSILKAKLFEMKAPLAGEMSGHIFFKEGWFGFDDGIYVGARLLRILSEHSDSIATIFANLPNSINTPELKLPMSEADKSQFMQALATTANFEEGNIITIDGLRVEFAEGWGLIRPSNTSPYLILRFEAENELALQQIKELFRRELLKINNKLILPF